MLAGNRTHRAGLGEHLTGPPSTCETSAARRHRAWRKLDRRAVLNVRLPDMIGLAVGVDHGVVAAFVTPAIDQHIVDAGFAQFPNVIFCG
jgi:hypothetical protein